MDWKIERYAAKYQLEQLIGADRIGFLTARSFNKGEIIIEFEEPVDTLFFFVEGRVKVVLPTGNGRQLLLCYYEPLQLFGDLELFEEEPLATTTIEALTPCICLGLDREFVVHQMATDVVFLRKLCFSLGRKLGRAVKNSALNLLYPLENRVASYILATATRGPDHQLIFTGNLTQIAELLGTSFRHLHRTLQSLCAQGILVKQEANYAVQQMKELERRAAGAYNIRD